MTDETTDFEKYFMPAEDGPNDEAEPVEDQVDDSQEPDEAKVSDEVTAQEDEAGDEAEKADDDSDDDDADPDDEGKADPDLYEELKDEVFVIKQDGKEVERKFSEIIQGYQRREDYQRKTQEVSAERKEMHAKYEGEMQLLASALERYAVPKTEMPDVTDYAGREAQFATDYAAWQKSDKERSEAAHLHNQIQDLAQQEAMKQCYSELLEAIPEWSDEAVAVPELESIANFAIEHYGFTQEEFSGATDSRLLRMARDAAKAPQNVEAKPVALSRKSSRSKLKGGSKTSAKASSTETRAKKARQNLKATGKSTDLESLYFTD